MIDILQIDYIPSLKSYRQALKREYCLPDVLCVGSDAHASLASNKLIVRPSRLVTVVQ